MTLPAVDGGAPMMIARPTIIEPMMMASALFWSSSISLRTENGTSFTIAMNVATKKTSPIMT